MKLSALVWLLLCLNQLWGTPCCAAEDSQGDLNSTLGLSDADNVTEEISNPIDLYDMLFGSKPPCTFYDVLEHLNLTENKDKFTLVRPVKDSRSITNVTLDVAIYAILDLDEIDQKFTSYLFTTITWKNDFIKWNPLDFCWIEDVTVTADTFWKPDIIIEDMIERDKSSPSPFMKIFFDGEMSYNNYQVVVSTCRVQAYKFPFDMQSCNLTFKSASYSRYAIDLKPSANSSKTTEWTRNSLKTQYEWTFINLTITEGISGQYFRQDTITYTILMKRRSSLYVVNYILPLMFFLSLDFASFLISDTGDKLGFKITVLLAVTVMQLLFNEILPSSSDQIPIISVFCVGIFMLMLLSLLECLLVLCMYKKDENLQQEQELEDIYKRLKDAVSLSNSICSSPTLLKAQRNDNVLLALADLKKEREEAGPGYWTKKAIMINRIFIFVYTIGVAVFLGTIFSLWLS